MHRHDIGRGAGGPNARKTFGLTFQKCAHLLTAEDGARSPLTFLDGSDLRHQLTNFFVVLFVWGHAKALLDLVRYEDADACVCHDADTDIHSSPRRKTSVPSLQTSVLVRKRIEGEGGLLPDAHFEREDLKDLCVLYTIVHSQ